ncbi:MAG: GTPase ObgE [Eubacteriales bacterium]
MFIDKVDIYIKAGRGGNGAVSFRREKYVSHGGPDGGDGGRGGNVVFVPDEGENTLLFFKYRRKFIAENGENGGNKKFRGKNGGDTVIRVPAGTVIRHKPTGKVIYDMSKALAESDGGGQDTIDKHKDKATGGFIAARGGNGGFGNTKFATPTRQAPRFAKAGREGEELELTLELKTLADIGIIGYPNVGKSTMLAAVSAARPKIADYHFTTLSPNLGVITRRGKNIVVADIPGLVEGASEGKGLGHEFLRHIDRCRLLIHVFDISATERPDPLGDIKSINKELKKWSPELASRPQALAANKCDLGYDESVLKQIKAYASRRGEKLFLVSAHTSQGLDELFDGAAGMALEIPPVKPYEREYFAPEESDDSFEIEVKDGVFYVTGQRLKNLCDNVNFDDRESLAFFQRTLKNIGVIESLEKSGVKEGDTINIYGAEFDFLY